MATTTPNYGWDVPTSTDYVKDGATAIETLGDDIDATLYSINGGTGSTGLHLISTTTVSSQSSLQINNCFSSTYDNYKIVISNLSASAAGGLMGMRLGTNVSLTNYAWIKAGMSTGAATNSTGASGQTYWGINFISSSVPAGFFTGDICNPFNSTYSYFNGIGYGGFTTGGVWFGQAFAGHYNATTSFTGLYLFPDSGTFSANVSIYGYRK